MSSYDGVYNVKAVSNLLGIQPGTLRAWERRYKMIAPKRNEAGHRIYSEEHIDILKWLLNKVDQGFTISQAVTLLENNQISVHNQSEMKSNKVEPDYSNVLMDELLQSLLNFDETEANERLNRAFSLFSVDKVVFDMLNSLLHQIEIQFDKGIITAAQMNFAFSFIRSRFGIILHTLPVEGLLPKVIAICGPNETYELGLLTLTIFLRRMGFEVIYIGASISDNDFGNVIENLKPAFLFLSCHKGENVEKIINLVDDLLKRYQQLHIGIIGREMSKGNSLNHSQLGKYLIGDHKVQWKKWLKEKLDD
ncbi:MerR family transcriptional regulator [Metabacillus rhizolycopersici]|uniref:MerR family transcriptional regulator n=1 Tax=Metabacillus rhizolycopersici TaxID=2875709 RepID=A0ABS7UWY1_9BACI|nr:MerR family transcriptional regulator [Metabacillus rhizolycopersici]MBZ5752806.1 MerR family transcriptional regulator [Metabacillus rhizolycopersici]